MVVVGSNLILVSTGEGTRSDGTTYDEWVYEGTKSAISAEYFRITKSGFTASYGYTGNELVVNHGPAKSSLTIRKSNTQRGGYDDVVRLLANKVQKSIFEAPLPTAFSSLTDTQIAEVKKAIADNTLDAAFDDEKQQWLYAAALRGVEYRITHQPILQRVVSQPSKPGGFSGFQTPYVNVGAILSTSAMVADAGIAGSEISYNLPNFVSDFDLFTWGWYKNFPQVEQGANNTTIVTREYEYGLWYNLLYDFVA